MLKNRNNKSENVKLIKRVQNYKLYMILPAIAILGLVLSFIHYHNAVKKTHLDHFQKVFSQNAKHKLTDMNTLLNQMVEHLEITGNEIDEYTDLDHPDITKILRLSTTAGWYEFTAVADAEGHARDNVGNIVDVSDRSYFQKAMQGEVAFSETLPSKVYEGDYVQIIAHPICRDNGSVKAVVFGVVNNDNFKNIGFETAPESDENTYIVDSNGNYVAHFQGDREVTKEDNFWYDAMEQSVGNKKISAIRQDFYNRKPGEFSYFRDNSERLVCYMPIGPNKWQLVYSLSSGPVDGIVTSIHKLDTLNTALVFICYALLFVSVVLYFRRVNKEIKKAYREAEANMELICLSVEHTNKIIFEFDQLSNTIQLKTDVHNLLFNKKFIKHVPQSFVNRNLIAPESIPVLEKLFEDIKVENNAAAEIQIVHDNAKNWYRISMKNILGTNDEIVDTVGIVEDISNIKKYEEETQQKLQIYNTLIENAIMYAKVDLTTNKITELNGDKTSLPFDAFIKERITKTVSKEQAAYVTQKLSLDSLKKAYQQDSKYNEVQFQRTVDGETIWVSCVVRKVLGENSNQFLFVITDIDKQKKEELLLRKRAERDGLTGLYNAVTTRAKVNEILSTQQQNNTNHVFILFDLDNYKQINDTFGHDFGDFVLKDVAAILNNRFRSSDIIGRIGGDEFVIFLRDIKGQAYAEVLMNELRMSLRKTYQQKESIVKISASIGIATAPKDGSTFEELYKKADIAQYQVKKQSKDGYKFYQE